MDLTIEPDSQGPEMLSDLELQKAIESSQRTLAQHHSRLIETKGLVKEEAGRLQELWDEKNRRLAEAKAERGE